MRVLKKLGTVATGTIVVIGGMTAAAAPASANTCAGPVPVNNPVYPGSFVNVCADAGTYDPDPSHAGFGVHAAASFSVSLSGYTRYCTDYYGAAANLNPSSPTLVEPDLQIGSPGGC